MDNNEIDSLYEELLKIEEIFIKSDVVTEHIEDEKVHLESTPLYDEYYGARVFSELSDKFDEREEKSALKDPDGGLTAEGRKFFKRTEGANLKPGVKGPADTPDKMRRKGSFLTRFFTNPSGPLVDEKGRATRLALSATAWGERVPKNAEDASALAAKGRALLERYENSKKKSEEIEDIEVKAGGSALGASIGQAAGGAAPTGTNPQDTRDHDGDGMIFDGTPQEQRKPYERSKDANYEKQRRKFVREQLRRQGIKANRRVEDRSKEERDARARARAAFDKVLRDGQGKPTADGLPKGPSYPPGQSVPKKYPPGQKPEYRKPEPPADRKPADRYPEPGKKYPPGQKPSPSSPRDQKPADRYPEPGKKYPPGQKPSPSSPRDQKPADRYPKTSNPSATRPGADRTEQASGPARGPRVDRDKNPDPGFFRPKPQVGPPAPKRTPGKNTGTAR